MLDEKSQSQKVIYYMILFIKLFWNDNIKAMGTRLGVTSKWWMGGMQFWHEWPVDWKVPISWAKIYNGFMFCLLRILKVRFSPLGRILESEPWLKTVSSSLSDLISFRYCLLPFPQQGIGFFVLCCSLSDPSPWSWRAGDTLVCFWDHTFSLLFFLSPVFWFTSTSILLSKRNYRHRVAELQKSLVLIRGGITGHQPP